MLELQIALSIIIILMLSIRGDQEAEKLEVRKEKIRYMMPKLERLKYRAPTQCGEQTGYNSYYICGSVGCNDCQEVNITKECDVAVRRAMGE